MGLKQPRAFFILSLFIVTTVGTVSSAVSTPDFKQQRTFTPSACSHKPEHDRMTHVHISPRDGEPLRSKRDASSFTEKFTMEVHYDDSVNTGLSSTTLAQIQNVIIPELKEFYESSLTIRKLPGPLIFDRACSSGLLFDFPDDDERYCAGTCAATTECVTVNIPPQYLKQCRECNNIQDKEQCMTVGTDGQGSNTSFVLLVSAITTSVCPTSTAETGSTLAFAGSCEMEDQFDRPVLGYVNFCPVSINAGQSDDYLLTVTKHEILHALGFSSGLFSWFRDEEGNPRTPRDSDNVPIGTSNNTLRSVTYTDWDTANGDVSHTVSLLVTPNIVEEGRRHFNCSTLEGVQLEDQGGSGTAGSHWEARILKGEFMNGVIDNNAMFSRLTFALLEDSGWYKVNYSFADQLVWGRASGCELAAGSCGGYIKSQIANNEASISPFCNYDQDPPSRYGCTVDRTAVSNCNLVQFTSPLPEVYRYFTNSQRGGAFYLADYCPFQEGFSNTICTDTTQNTEPAKNFLAQKFGPNSRCVEHGEPWVARQGSQTAMQQFTRAGCYEYTCSGGLVTIHILDQSYTCMRAGQKLDLSQTSNGIEFTGSIICPSCLDICYDDFVNCPEAALVYSEFAALADIGSGDFIDLGTEEPTDRTTTPGTTDRPRTTTDDNGRSSGTTAIHALSFMFYVSMFITSFYLLF